MWLDPIVDEVRRTRERLAEAAGFDVGAIFADLRQRETHSASRLVRRQKNDRPGQPAGPDGNPAALHPGR